MQSSLCCGMAFWIGAVVCATLHSAEIRFGDRAAFDAAASSQTVRRFDFETASGFPAAPAEMERFFDKGRIQPLSTQGVLSALFPAKLRKYPADSANQVVTGVTDSPDTLSNETIYLHFDPPVYGFALDLVDLQPGIEQVSITIGRFGAPASIYRVADDDADVTTPVCFGLLRDEPIQVLGLRSYDRRVGDEMWPGTPQAIDNLAVVVPEPAATLLLTLAAAGLLQRRKR